MEFHLLDDPPRCSVVKFTDFSSRLWSNTGNTKWSCIMILNHLIYNKHWYFSSTCIPCIPIPKPPGEVFFVELYHLSWSDFTPVCSSASHAVNQAFSLEVQGVPHVLLRSEIARGIEHRNVFRNISWRCDVRCQRMQNAVCAQASGSAIVTLLNAPICKASH